MTDEASRLPSKLYYRIGEVASLVGVEPHVLRYWEREFRTIRPKKSARGQRVYSRRDVETLMRVRELLYSEGFTIAGARRRLQQERSGSTELDGPDARPADSDAEELEAVATAPSASPPRPARMERVRLDGGSRAEPFEAVLASARTDGAAHPDGNGNGAEAAFSAAAPMQTLPAPAVQRGTAPAPALDARPVAPLAPPPREPMIDAAAIDRNGKQMRAALRDLRREVETFLDELG